MQLCYLIIVIWIKKGQWCTDSCSRAGNGAVQWRGKHHHPRRHEVPLLPASGLVLLSYNSPCHEGSSSISLHHPLQHPIGSFASRSDHLRIPVASAAALGCHEVAQTFSMCTRFGHHHGRTCLEGSRQSARMATEPY